MQTADPETTLDPGLRPPCGVVEGIRYLRFLRRMHAHLQPEWYLEVGTHMGRSLAHSFCNAIAVDPEFKIDKNVIGGRGQVHFFQQTSDDFFASGIAGRLARRMDLVFLDGMHRIEYLLRDFINAEQLCGPDSVITIHDAIPVSYVGAERDWDRQRTNAWTGDIWKIVPILREYRPDLKVDVVDCAPSGLAVVSQLDPKNRDLTEDYADIVARYQHMTISEFGEDNLSKCLDVLPYDDASLVPFVGRKWAETSSASVAREPKPSVPVDFALKVPAGRTDAAAHCGEYNYAVSLAKALAKLGHTSRVDCYDRWDDNRNAGEVEIVIRGIRPSGDSKGNTRLLWVQSHADAITREEMVGTHHAFVASENRPHSIGRNESSTLLQCTDQDLFYPAQREPALATDVLFVGNSYPKRQARGMVKFAMDAGVEVAVYGRSWNWVTPGWWRGRDVPNEDLVRYYCSANVVLNDHHPTMRAHGFVNNRIYDVLACGVPLVSDRVEGLPDGFAEFIFFADTPEELVEAIAAAKAEDPNRRARRLEFADHVRSQHSFDARASEIVRVAAPLMNKTEQVPAQHA